jgi:hypothetical protein
MVKPLDVLAVLERAGVRCLLIGTYATVGWTNEPRATQDVDVLVAARSFRPATRALVAAYPRLVAEETPTITRFTDRNTGRALLDVFKACQPLLRRALRRTQTVRAGRRTYRIPDVDTTLALKFAALVNCHGDQASCFLHAADFIRLVRQNPDLDPETLAELGELAFPGGGKKLTEMTRRARAGKMPIV